MTSKKKPVAQRSFGEILADAEAGWEPSAKEKAEIQVIAKKHAAAMNAIVEQIQRELERVTAPFRMARQRATEAILKLFPGTDPDDIDADHLLLFLKADAAAVVRDRKERSQKGAKALWVMKNNAKKYARKEFLKLRAAKPGEPKKTIVYVLIKDLEEKFPDLKGPDSRGRNCLSLRNVGEKWLKGLSDGP